MIRSILVALDGSGPSRSAGRNAALAARWLGARLRAVFVDDSAERARQALLPITPGTPVGGVPVSILMSLDDLKEEVVRRRNEVADFLHGLCEEMDLEGVTLETVRGRPADCIVRLGHQVDLLVMGQSGLGAGADSPHGEGEHGQTPDTLGSTTEAVLHHANKPVLVSSPTDSLDRCELRGPIVVAYDGRHPANNALAAACLFAEQARTEPPAESLELIVLCVKDTEREAQPLLQEARQYLLPPGERVEDLAHRRVGELAHRRVEAQFVWQGGTVSEAIVDRVQAAGGGMVAMGAFGESRLKEVFLGSHTRRVLLACHCPVLLSR